MEQVILIYKENRTGEFVNVERGGAEGMAQHLCAVEAREPDFRSLELRQKMSRCSGPPIIRKAEAGDLLR